MVLAMSLSTLGARCWPSRDHRSVTTAGVTMVPRSADQRLVVSAVHDLEPFTHGLQGPRTSGAVIFRDSEDSERDFDPMAGMPWAE